MKPLLRHFLAAAACVAASPAQDTRGLAIVNARILPMNGPAIARGTLLVRGGKIEQLGADVAVPAGYQVVDAQGGTLMPGAVNAHAHTGLAQATQAREERPNQFRRGGRGRRGGGTPGPAGSSENKSGEKVIEQLYARQEVFAELLRDGITTLGIAPLGRGLTGQGAVVRPYGDDVAAMTVAGSAFLAISPAAETRTKDLIRRALEDGKRAAERRRRRAEARTEEVKTESKPADGATKPEGEAQKPVEGKPPESKPPENKPPENRPPENRPPENTPPGDRPSTRPAAPSDGTSARNPAAARPQGQAAPDPAAEAVADLIEGKTRAFVQVDSAMEFLHWAEAAKDASFPVVYIARRHATAGSQGSLELVLDKLKASKGVVLMTPEFATLPNTEYLVNLSARLLGAGIEVGFLLPERGRALTAARTQLMELVRAGLPAEAALRGITSIPAKALGVDKQLGSLAAGKAANLLLWSGDPLDPLAELQRVWLEGREVEDVAR